MLNDKTITDYELFVLLNNFLLSDWINHHLQPIGGVSEYELDIVNQISYKILDSYNKLINKKLEDGIDVLNQLENLIPKCQLFNFLFDFHLLKAQYFIAKFQMQNAFDSLQQIEKPLFNPKYNSDYYLIRRVYFYKLNAQVINELKKPEEALQESFKGINLSEKYHFNHKTFELYMYTVSIYRHSGNYPKANESALKCLHIANELNDQIKMVASFSVLSAIAEREGNFEKGIDYAKKGVIIARDSNLSNLYFVLINLSNIYWRKGYLKEVLPLLLEAKQLIEKTGNKRYLFTINNNLGLYLVTRGDYEAALKYFLHALEINIETKFDTQLPYIYSNLANLYYEMNNLELSEFYFLKTLESSEKTNNVPFQIDSLTGLVLIASLIYNNKKANQILEKLSSIINCNSGKIDTLRYKLAKGYALETSGTLEEMKQAQDIFNKIMYSESEDFEVNNLAYLHYCRTVFKCFIDFGSKIDWVEIRKHLESLQDSAKRLNLFNTYAIAKILLSKVISLNDSYEEAEIILLEILKETEIRGFDLIFDMTKESLKTLKRIRFGIENVNFESSSILEKRKMMENDIIKFIENLI